MKLVTLFKIIFTILPFLAFTLGFALGIFFGDKK